MRTRDVESRTVIIPFGAYLQFDVVPYRLETPGGVVLSSVLQCRVMGDTYQLFALAENEENDSLRHQWMNVVTGEVVYLVYQAEIDNGRR